MRNFLSNLPWAAFATALFASLLAPRSANAAQNQADAIADSLRKLGYENVLARANDDTLYVVYENRRLRDDAQAIAQILRVAASHSDSITVLALAPTKRRIPLVTVVFSKRPPGNVPKRESNNRSALGSRLFFWTTSCAHWSAEQAAPSPLRKLDVILLPQLKLQLGDMTDPVKYQLNLAPTLSTMPWSGGQIVLQIVLPVHNELSRAESRVRPGLLVMNQLWRLPWNWNTFVSVSGGYFTSYRYGLDLRVSTYPLRGRLAVFGSLGRTGYAFIDGHTVYYSRFDRTTYSFSAWYHLSYSDLSLGAEIGQFLYGDKGWRVDIVRRFGEFRLGFFALLTELGRNGGFTLSIPLPPRTYAHPGRLRFRAARRFSWEYRYRALRNPGITYWTGFNDPLIDLDPPHLENQLDLFRLPKGW